MSRSPRPASRGRLLHPVVACIAALLLTTSAAHAADQPPTGGTTVGDFNGDGFKDFTSAASSATQLEIIFGSAEPGVARSLSSGGTGVRLTLAGAQPSATATYAFRPPIRIGDFDGDKIDDVLLDGFVGKSWVVYGARDSGTVAVAEGDPRVTMLLDHTGAQSTGTKASYGIGDFDGDGTSDFIHPRVLPSPLTIDNYEGHAAMVFGGTLYPTGARKSYIDTRTEFGNRNTKIIELDGQVRCSWVVRNWLPTYECRSSFTWPIPIGDYNDDGATDLYQEVNGFVITAPGGNPDIQVFVPRLWDIYVPSRPPGDAWTPVVKPLPAPREPIGPPTTHDTYECNFNGVGKVQIRYTPELPENWPAGNTSIGLKARLDFNWDTWNVLHKYGVQDLAGGTVMVPVTLPSTSGAPVQVAVPLTIAPVTLPESSRNWVAFSTTATGRSPVFTAPTGPASGLTVTGRRVQFFLGLKDPAGKYLRFGYAGDQDTNADTFDAAGCISNDVFVPRDGSVGSDGPTPTPTATPTPTPEPNVQTGMTGWRRSVDGELADGLVLTDGLLANVAGWAYDDRVQRDANRLEVEFDLDLGTIPGTAPGNGATLAFASASLGGRAGAGNPGLGLGWVTNKGNAIVFGTVKGGLTPSDNYVGIVDSVVGRSGYPNLLQSAPAVSRLANASTHVKVRAFGGIVTVELNGVERLRRTMRLPTDAWVGFTAGTSTARQRTAVRNVVIRAL
jgi:hypothetical protein